MLAKIASDWNKPNGQFEIQEEEVPTFMYELPVRRLWGVGAKSAELLEQRGVRTCGDLQRFTRFQLYQMFGKFGLELYALCRGIDSRSVTPDRVRKSLSTECTFSSDLTSPAQCAAKIPELFEELSHDLNKSGMTTAVRSVLVKIRFSDFSRTTVEQSGMPVTLESFLELLHRGLTRKELAVRLLGLGVRFREEEEDAKTDQLSLPL